METLRMREKRAPASDIRVAAGLFAVRGSAPPMKLVWASALVFVVGGCRHDNGSGVHVAAEPPPDGKTNADASAFAADLAALADGPSVPPPKPASTQWTHLLGIGSSLLGNSLTSDRVGNVYFQWFESLTDTLDLGRSGG
jgi:hypothetical protein